MRSPYFLLFFLMVLFLTCVLFTVTLVALREPFPPDGGARLAGYSARL